MVKDVINTDLNLKPTWDEIISNEEIIEKLKILTEKLEVLGEKLKILENFRKGKFCRHLDENLKF